MPAKDRDRPRSPLDRPEYSPFFPAYLFEEVEVRAGILRKFFFWLLQLPVQAFIWIVLRPRLGAVGHLSQDEVDRIYTREASNYDSKHHFTTRGQDTAWRRLAGWVVAHAPADTGGISYVLDLCTGTGLTVQGIVEVLGEYGRRADITGLDYNEAMLAGARRRFGTSGTGWRYRPPCNVRFTRGSALQFVDYAQATYEEDAKGPCLPSSLHVVTQIFGIGGIKDPLPVFCEVLAVLKEGGQYFLVDMHRPVRRLPGEWPLLGTWLSTSNLEAYTWLHTTLPLALARLWGWRDTTWDFYWAPLTTMCEGGAYWGFRILWREVESERWWLGLPVMPTCKLLLEKVRISKAEFEIRQQAMADVTYT